ncbi:iron-sulfur cluster biosynthesis family protein [Companilactobacillus musae]|uniref:iron-sulfur cluster biosynthesis family protein n=1 Tax=Companilactobacillus musae TaxID=1903258 RepID=UPI000E64A328|nr:iron-sulfur cluster biosynthesis family protein [Companilactobacillus musae]
MKITIKPAAQEFLAKIIPTNGHVILTTDDGSNKYSSIGATCELADKFQLIILNQDDPKFSTILENNTGYDIRMLPAEEYLLGVDLNIDLKNTKLILQDKSGILDSNLSVVDWRNVAPETEKERFETMQRLGDQIC